MIDDVSDIAAFYGSDPAREHYRFSSFISRFGIMGDLLKNIPDWIEDQAEVRSLLERG
jgi:hypothetical protein